MDDLLITGNDVDSIIAIKKVLHSAFSIKDIGLACYFLIELAQFSRGIFHNQKKVYSWYLERCRDDRS